jgi:hypothetical protein
MGITIEKEDGVSGSAARNNPKSDREIHEYACRAIARLPAHAGELN